MFCRKPDELEFLAPRLMAMARALGLNTTLKLYCTGEVLLGLFTCTNYMVIMHDCMLSMCAALCLLLFDITAQSNPTTPQIGRCVQGR
jgi:hypothetical protein